MFKVVFGELLAQILLLLLMGFVQIALKMSPFMWNRKRHSKL